MEHPSHNTKKAQFLFFLPVALVIFVLALSAANSIGFVPYYIDGTSSSRPKVSVENLAQFTEAEVALPAEETTGIAPTRIVIKEIGLDLPISNPSTRDLEELDAVLKDGPARYVDSALLGESGNLLLFGHSSHLPVIINQMYKAFNKIPDLKAGDSISVQGGGKEYLYRVTSVKQVDAEEGIIDLARTGKKLTIVTCDTLTGKSARFVLEAEFVGSYSL